MKKTLNVKEIFIDEELYPRNGMDWQTSYSYQQSMKSGAKFPPIVVAYLDGKYFLVDGAHRLKAYKGNKVMNVLVEVIRVRDKKELFVQAIKRNITHGAQLSIQEKLTCAKKLLEMKVNMDNVTSIICIPKDQLKNLFERRITNTITGGEIVLKKGVEHLAGRIVEEQEVSKTSGDSQAQLIDRLIYLIKNKLLNTKNKKIKNKLLTLKKLIR